MAADIKYHIGIVGCGKMGNDLFEFLRGFDISMVFACSKEEFAENLQAVFEKNQKRLLRYKLINDKQYEFHLKHTKITSDLAQLAGCSLVIEAVNEEIDLKKALFRKIEKIVTKDCIIASNTSSISPDRLFKKMINPERCLGLHFFFPVKMKDFVEINMASNASGETLEKLTSFVGHIGKYALVLHGEEHFLINRIFLKMQAGCCRLVSEREMSYREIDEQVKAGLFPVGVFEFFDHVGIDIMLQSVKNYMSYEPDPLFYQPLIDILEDKVGNGKLGKKTAAGFYDYAEKGDLQKNDMPEKNDVLLKQIANWYLDGVFRALSTKVCTKNELAKIVKEYMMTEKNPFDLAEELGYTFK